MALLLIVSLVWAFSFGLIKGRLAGLDPVAVAAVRLLVATLVFLPWIRARALPGSLRLRLAGIGAIQFGLMYVAYLRAFVFLQAYEVALFTLFTPLYLTLLEAAHARRWSARYLLAAGLAVVGAGVVVWQQPPGGGAVTGFLLVQASNLCFAAGQLAYRRLRPEFPATVNDRQAFAWATLGGAGATGLASLFFSPWAQFAPTLAQWGVMIYLGAIASGAGFLLWNMGATRVNAGTLAVFNNAKVPLGIACSLLFFGEKADPVRLGASLAVLALAVLVAEARIGRVKAPASAS